MVIDIHRGRAKEFWTANSSAISFAWQCFPSPKNFGKKVRARTFIKTRAKDPVKNKVENGMFLDGVREMKKKTWKSRIRKACREAGMYKPCFDHVIDALAGIMELRDNAREKYEESGGSAVTEHTNNGGTTNIVKNPALTVILDCEALALAYWKELGLTSKAYKTITGDKGKPEEKKNLDKIRTKFKVAK